MSACHMESTGWPKLGMSPTRETPPPAPLTWVAPRARVGDVRRRRPPGPAAATDLPSPRERLPAPHGGGGHAHERTRPGHPGGVPQPPATHRGCRMMPDAVFPVEPWQIREASL